MDYAPKVDTLATLKKWNKLYKKNMKLNRRNPLLN